MITIKDLILGQPTIAALDILARADRLVGKTRYFGGALTPEEIASLVINLRLQETPGTIKAGIQASKS